MVKQLNVSLAFNADTSKAKAQIQELYQSLNNVTTSTAKLPITTQIQEAQTAAVQLKTAMNQAFDVNTGKLDLLKFNQSIKASGTSLSEIRTRLMQIGPTGQQAFLSLAQSIAAAEIPAKRTSALLTSLGTTLKNTVKWQLSSSMLHGFMTSVQTAYRYTQDLNESLNNIRIVTGLSSEEMDRFAIKANKAAKALSASTLDYTNASLIYYQQGLDPKEVDERAAVTLKMANVTGTTAQEVSNQMTAVWNNFDDGSKSLEYYADVMTALGAATASSTDEISQGLQKFAAVASTVGLSYEYATTALATITAETRESADIVGTALKTLFARIQGLQQGETLEDGTSLNKYSAALAKVGIDIKDANGQMKEMDTILNEMGAKWGTLAKDQQLALAQTVAGVRQYTQLVALMDNWGTFQENLNIAQNAEGALQEQADIYAESWEAARKRVQTAMQAIYTDLLNDKFFISLANSLEKVLTLFDQFLDSMGGARGVLLGLGSLLLNTFSGSVAKSIENMVYNVKSFIGIAQKEAIATQNAIIAQTKMPSPNGGVSQTNILDTNTTAATTAGMQAQLQLTHAIAQKRESMSVSQQMEAQGILEQNKAYADQVALLAKKADAARANKQITQEEIVDLASLTMNTQKVEAALAAIDDQVTFGETVSEKIAEAKKSFTEGKIDAEAYKAVLKELAQEAEKLGLLGTSKMLKSLSAKDDKYLETQNIGTKVRSKARDETLQNAKQNFKGTVSDQTLTEHVNNTRAATKATKDYEKAIGSLNQHTRMAEKQIKNFQNTSAQVTQKIVSVSQSMMSLSFAISQMQRLGSIWSDEDLTTGEKLLQTFMAFGTAVPMLVNGITGLNGVLGLNYTISNATIASLTKEQVARLAGLSIEEAEVAIKQAGFMASIQAASGDEIETAALKKKILTMSQEAMVEQFGITMDQAAIIQSELNAGATLKEAMAKAGLQGIQMQGIRLTFASTAAKLAETGGVLANAAAWVLNYLAMAPVLVIVLALVAAIGLLAGAILGITKLIQFFKAQSPEGQLKKAKEETEAMTEAAEDAKTAYQDLLNTINNYDSAIAALEDMEVGTQEFTNALIKANEEAWKLIDAYGLIQGIDWDYGDNGEIIIKQESKDKIVEEQNEKREDAIVAASAAKINEKQKAYDAAKDDAYGSLVYSVAEGNLTEEQQKKVYDVFGFSNGESKHLQERIKNATPEQEEEIINELGAKYFGDQWGKGENAAMQRQFIVTAMSQMENIGKAYDAYKDLTTTEANERQKMISTSMSDEEAYQKSEYKGAIVNSLEDKYDEEKAKQDEKYAGMSKKDVQNAFDQYLSDQGYIQEDGKVYKVKEDGTKGDEVVALSNLDTEGQRNVLAARDTAANLEAQGIEIAEKVNNITKDLGEEEKAVAKAAIDGDVSNLTEEQITKISGMSEDEIKKTYPAIEELANQLGLSIDEVIAKLKSGAEDWKPPEFNVEEWKKDYSDKMKIINDLETGDSISAEDYALLGEEYQQYFQVQADGTAILIGKAEELKAKAQEIEIESIKKDITGKQEVVGNTESGLISSSTGEGPKLSFNAVHEAAKSGDIQEEYSQGYIDAINKALDTNYTSVEQAAAAWDEYKNSLSSSQDTLASTATSIQDLDKMLADGLITQEQYNNAFKGTIYKEAQAEGFDVEELQNYADHLKEVGDLSEEMALKIALAEKKQGKATDDLVKNYKDYATVLKKAKLDPAIKGTEEYSKAIGSLRKDLSLLTGVSEDVFTEDFINSDAVQQALTDVANGVEGATERLKALAVVHDIKVNTNVDDSKLNALQSELAIICAQDYAIGTRVDNSAALMGLYDLLYEAGLTTEQIQGYFNKLGWDPELDYVKMKASDAGKTGSYTNKTVWVPDGMGWKQITLTDSGQLAQYGDQEIWVPRIGSKTGGGGFRKIDPPGGGSSSKPSGGGGGGGSNKPPEKKSVSETGRYHTIENQLEDLKSEYEDISEAADRAFGQDKLDAIDEQIKKNEELITSQEELLGTYGDVSLEGLDLDNFSNFENLRQNLDFDKAKMEAYFKDLMGTGISFEYDEKGNISNFRQIEDYMLAQYNKNTTALGEEDWEIFEKKYQRLEEQIQQYEETYDKLRDAEKEYQDLLNQRIDLQLTKVQYAVELKLNVSEDDMAILEYQFDLLEDRAFASAKRITESTKQAENIYDQIQFNQQGLEETLALSGARIEDIFNGNIEGFTFTADQIDAIKEYRDNLLDLNTQLIEAQKQIEEQVIEAFNEFHDELDKGMEKFDHYNTMLESYRNIVDIIGKDVLKLDNGQIAKITSAQVDNSIKQLNAARDAYDTYRAAADDAKAKMDEYKTKVDNTNNKALKDSYQQDYEFWKQAYEEMDSSAREAQEELMDTWGSTLEAVVSQFEMAVEAAVETFNDAIYQLGGLEGLSNEFSMIKEKDDMLLDDYQKIYELSKLTRDINNSIDDTDNIGGKQKLKKLLQDINKLQEDGVEISQYDLEYLQKTYDLRLAELELEEAQRAKNTVRLSRDNEGNWSYIYTQNTDAVDAAQQKYEDALYAMQDLSSNYIDEMSEKLISTSQDMLAAISELRVEDFASQEDYYKEILRIEKMYKDQMAIQEVELNNAINNNKILYNTDWKNYSEATGYKISAAEDFATAFKDTLLGSLMDSEENTSTFAEFIGKATEQLTGELNQIAGTYYANIGNAMEAAGTKTGDFAEMLEENITAIQSESKKAAEAVADMAEQMDNDFIDIMDNVARWQEDYGREIDKIINKNELLINSFNDMIKALSGDMNEIDIRYNISSNTEAEEATGSGEVTVPEGTVSGATGMYTGNWNSKEGRVAVLHQKELLLNENDTSNFLTAIKITRAMLETIDLNARQASFGLGNLTPSSVKDEKTQTLEQAVHITAEFPNVSDHNEIEQAFTNLINTASQYANRK